MFPPRAYQRGEPQRGRRLHDDAHGGMTCMISVVGEIDIIGVHVIAPDCSVL